MYSSEGGRAGGVPLNSCTDDGNSFKSPPTKTQLLSELVDQITNYSSVCVCVCVYVCVYVCVHVHVCVCCVCVCACMYGK